jgi:hypothetical protein
MAPTPGRQSDLFDGPSGRGRWSRLRSVQGRRKWATQSIPHDWKNGWRRSCGAGARRPALRREFNNKQFVPRPLLPQRPQRETPSASWKCGSPGLPRVVLACGSCAGGMQ